MAKHDNSTDDDGTALLAEWGRFDLNFRHFQLLFVAIKAGIPEVLADGPHTLNELSDALAFPADRLLRILRGLLWCGTLTTDTDGAYLLTPAGRGLLDDGPHSLACNLRWQGEFFFDAWGHLWDYLANGDVPFKKAHNGVALFDLLNDDTERAALFAAPMTARSSQHAQNLVAHSAFTGLRAKPFANGQPPVVVDVGGGSGKLLAEVLKAIPNAQGILFELPVLEDVATSLIVAEGLVDRCQFVPGNMFDAVPETGDVYLMKWILHDWNDADAVRILQRCASAMRSGGKQPTLLVLERLMPDVVGSANTGLVQADLNMLCQMGGAERTRAEYVNLFGQAGLQCLSMELIDAASGLFAMECVLSSGNSE